MRGVQEVLTIAPTAMARTNIMTIDDSEKGNKATTAHQEVQMQDGDDFLTE
jgi:hypothetical protein